MPVRGANVSSTRTDSLPSTPQRQCNPTHDNHGLQGSIMVVIGSPAAPRCGLWRRRARIASDEHRRNAIPKNRDRGMARYPPLIGGGFLYGGLAAAYHRHRRCPESRADQKHRTEFAPLLVQEFGRDRNSRSSRLGNPEPGASRGTCSTRLNSGNQSCDQSCTFPIGSYKLSPCCESSSEERSAGNLHATFCGNRGRATASGDPVVSSNGHPYRDPRSVTDIRAGVLHWV